MICVFVQVLGSINAEKQKIKVEVKKTFGYQ
jgi:hypothetical protein